MNGDEFGSSFETLAFCGFQNKTCQSALNVVGSFTLRYPRSTTPDWIR